MTSEKSKEMEIVKLKREVSNLKEILIDHRSSQISINSQILAQLDSLNIWKSRTGRLVSHLKHLNEKYKESKIELNLLKDLFVRGKCSCVCECSRIVDFDKKDQEKTKKNSTEESGQVVDFEKKEKEQIKKQSKGGKKPGNKEMGSQTDLKKTENDKNKEIQIDDTHSYSSSDQRIYHYTEEQMALSGTTLTSVNRNYGLLQFVNQYGEWEFSPAENEEIKWSSISRQEKDYLFSKMVILPNLMSGLTVAVVLTNFEKGTNQFQSYLIGSGVCFKRNISIPLPVKVGLELSIELKNGDFYKTAKHEFTIEMLGNSFPPNNYIIAPCDYINKNKLPRIICKFSAVE